MNKNNWVGVDWGSSRLRVWYCNQNEIIDFKKNDQGVKYLKDSQAFAEAFSQITKGWDLQRVPIIAGGMVGSKDGWQEVPYVFMRSSAPLKFKNLVNNLYELNLLKSRELQTLFRKTRGKSFKLGKFYLIPGIAQKISTAPEIMRGEEVQLLGLSALRTKMSYLKASVKPKFEERSNQLAILPGTHSKWAWLLGEDGEMLSQFQTFMTGELFNLLAQNSLLKNCVTLPNSISTNFMAFRSLTVEKKYFLEGLKMVKEQTMTEKLFHIRSHDMLYGPNPIRAYYRLSGLIIGTEIRHGLRIFKLLGTKSLSKFKIFLLGNSALNVWYMEALKFFGYPKNLIEIVDSDKVAFLGLAELYAQLQKKEKRIEKIKKIN